MIFPTLNTVPENANIFASAEFSPSCSDSMSVSIQINTALMTDKSNPHYQVFGSNISGNVADMVAVKDESGTAGTLLVTAPFVRNSFPFRWIGIQYTAGSDVGAGTFSAYIEKKVQRVNIA